MCGARKPGGMLPAGAAALPYRAPRTDRGRFAGANLRACRLERTAEEKKDKDLHEVSFPDVMPHN